MYPWWPLPHLIVSTFHMHERVKGCWAPAAPPTASGMVIYRDEKTQFLPARSSESSPIMSEALMDLIRTPHTPKGGFKITWYFFFGGGGGI